MGYFGLFQTLALLLKTTVFLVFFTFSPLLTADFHRCSKALSAKDQDTAPCIWYQRVYKSLCPISWVRFSRRVPSFRFLRLDFYIFVYFLVSPAGSEMGRAARSWIFPWKNLNNFLLRLSSSL